MVTHSRRGLVTLHSCSSRYAENARWESLLRNLSGRAQNSVRFEVDSEIQEYPLTGVQVLHFGEAAESQTSSQDLMNIPAGKHVMLGKKGQFVAGSYQGGTKDSLRFQVEETIQDFRVTDMLFIMFGKAASPQTATSPQTTAQGQDLVTLAVGTGLMVRLNETLQTDKNQTGDSFLTILETDLAVNGVIVAQRGTRVYGKITEARKGQRLAGKAKIAIELSNLEIDRQLYPIVTSGYETSGDRQGTLLKTGTGLLIGGAIDGEDGAKIGTSIGVGASVLTDGNQIQIQKNSLLEFTLQEAATVPVAQLAAPVTPSQIDTNNVPVRNRGNLPASPPTKRRGRLR